LRAEIRDEANPMPYRPITPLKGPGVVLMEALYDEQEGARQAQRADAARSRAAAPSRRRTVGLAAALLTAALLVGAAVAALPRSGPAATPSAIVSLATLAGDAPTTTAFDGQRYTIAFTAANPMRASARMYAVKQGYSFDIPDYGSIAFVISGPQGGADLGYFDGGGEPNTGVRIVVAASDLTVDGSALR
jgi:hypothetical protein